MRQAFTLIELLVVVTIIVVLLALLTPALEKAIYQAELTQCAMQAGTMARGALLYAGGNRRRYPYRATLSDWSARRRPFIIRDDLGAAPGTGIGGTTPDDRPILRDALGGTLKPLLDPFSPPINLDHQTLAITSAHYSLWFGMSYDPGGNNSGAAGAGGGAMLKQGDRLGWIDDSRGQVYTVRSRILVSDWDLIASSVSQFINSHPDDRGIMVEYSVESSQWVESAHSSTTPRGAVDQHHAFDDGSVQRIDRVEWNDDRLARVPYDYWADNWTTDAASGVWLHLPRH